VPLGIEGHVVSPLDTPERVREAIERVGSPAMRFNADPVNFVGTLADVYDSAPLLNRLFDLLGPFTVAAHAKDVDVEDRHVLHIREVVIGEGRLDQETFLRRFEAACPDGFVLIEHLPDDRVPKAKAALDAAARRAGLRWKE
jgi:sugar phosphate isomerase/epimerase